MKEIQELLERFGLSDKQARVFLAISQLGNPTAKQIASMTGFSRTNIYHLSEGLINQGLVAEVERKGVRRFHAVDHDGLVALAGHKQWEMGEIKKQIIERASDFHALVSKREQETSVRFFEGIEGVYKIYYEARNDLAKRNLGDELLTLFSPDQIQKAIPDWFEKTQLMDHGLHTPKRGILFPSSMYHKYVSIMTQRNSLHQYRSWPHESDEFPTDTLCWLDKLAIVDLGEHPSGFIVQNKAMAKTFQLWFDFMWRSLGS